MDYQTTTRKGKRFVLVPEDEFKRLSGESEFVPMPPVAADGTCEAIPFARASIANSIIRGRKALGWSQSELARQAKMNVATLNRIEKGKVTPDTVSVARIERALKRG